MLLEGDSHSDIDVKTCSPAQAEPYMLEHVFSGGYGTPHAFSQTAQHGTHTAL